VKKHRPVKAALEGINAVSCGMLVAAAFLLFEPLDSNLFNIAAIWAPICSSSLRQILVPIDYWDRDPGWGNLPMGGHGCFSVAAF
jgi:chromate transporter